MHPTRSWVYYVHGDDVYPIDYKNLECFVFFSQMDTLEDMMPSFFLFSFASLPSFLSGKVRQGTSLQLEWGVGLLPGTTAN